MPRRVVKEMSMRRKLGVWNLAGGGKMVQSIGSEYGRVGMGKRNGGDTDFSMFIAMRAWNDSQATG